MSDSQPSPSSGRRVVRALPIALLGAGLLAGPALGGTTVKVFLTSGSRVEAVARVLPPGQRGAARAFAVRSLLAGPTRTERRVGLRTLIPPDTRLRGISVRRGVATVTLSRRFALGGRAPARVVRVGQVVYTLRQFPAVRRVRVVLGDGRPFPQGAALRLLHRRGLPATGGPRGNDVTSIQRRLVELRYLPPEAVTGQVDYRTGQALLAFQAWEGLARDGVAGARTIARLRRAGPPSPETTAPGRRVEVYRSRGVTLLVDNGRVVRAVHSSSGRPGWSTPGGTFSVVRKELLSWSVPFQVLMPYASYFVGGIAFHGYSDVPAYPASHGCVRLSLPEAPFVYEFARPGTPVAVI
jgi:lipoprotein-anchoring transpeptidase ErfK/SrfK